ncbi:MAG: hypothetical protein IJ124_05160 [Clostridia bacterium]|nr:hypothetical protein [Clostridia bacterium]MBQ8708106.1 hypothetical protein [Succinivibrionaceae bacterium]MBQ8708152.1 hypothetical protein [Succinivibrionaceae bacterium]
MAHVKVWYVKPVLDHGEEVPPIWHVELCYLEAESKKVEWDGATLICGRHRLKDANPEGAYMLFYDDDEDVVAALNRGVVWIKRLEIDGQLIKDLMIEESLVRSWGGENSMDELIAATEEG